MDPKLYIPMHSRILAIPYWVAQAVRRKNLKLETLLDFKKSREILSENDIKTLLCAEKLNQAIFGTGLHCFKPYEQAFSRFWFSDKSTPQTSAEEEQIGNKLHLEPDFIKDVEARLFADSVTIGQDVYITRQDPVSGYEIVPLRDQAVGVVLYNSIGEKLNKPEELQYNMLRDIVQQLYAYEQPTTLQGSWIYGMYLKTLHHRKLVAA